MSDETQAIVARVEKLERHNRWMKLAAGSMLVLAFVALLMGQAPPEKAANVVTAERFVVVDKAGKVRAALGLAPDGSSCLILMDKAQKIRAGLSVTGLILHDMAGKARAALNVLTSDNEPGLRLIDKDGKIRAALGLAGLRLIDKDGKMHASLGVSPDTAALILDSKDGKVGASLSVHSNRMSSLLLGDRKTHARLSIYPDSSTKLVLGNKIIDGKP